MKQNYSAKSDISICIFCTRLIKRLAPRHGPHGFSTPRQVVLRTGGRVVDRASLENWYGGNSIGGSNPPLSAINNSAPFGGIFVYCVRVVKTRTPDQIKRGFDNKRAAQPSRRRGAQQPIPPLSATYKETAH